MTSIAAVFRRVGVLLRSWRWRWFLRPRTSTIEQIKARKAERLAAGVEYAERPQVSVIVQSFNQVRNVAALEEGLRRADPDELIVCEDGSLDGSHERWRERLTRPNDFLLHSNDVHEIRSYDRAIAFARGEFVCLMQDDDRPPTDGGWLAEAVGLFEAYPDLAILGCWCGFNEFFDEAYNAPWDPPADRRIPLADPNTGRPFVFVENVNVGPYLLRRSTYHDLGGFDHDFSAPGEPGITFESELCYRAWRGGYEVALIDVPVKFETGEESYILPGGTSLWGLEQRNRNEQRNKERIHSLYSDHLDEIQAAVARANDRLTPR